MSALGNWHPMALVRHLYDSAEIPIEAIAGAAIQRTGHGYIHLRYRLRQLQDDTLTPDTRAWRRDANTAAEIVDHVDLASQTPVAGLALPKKASLLVPIQMVAMTALTIKCWREHLEIRKKEKMHQRRSELPIFFLPYWITPTVWNNGDGAREVMASVAMDTTNLMFRITAVPDNVWFKLKTMTEKVELWPEQHALALRYALLYGTVLGDDEAMYDALCNLPEYLKLIQSEGSQALERMICYWKRKVTDREWFFDKERAAELSTMHPESCLGRVQEYISKLPQGGERSQVPQQVPDPSEPPQRGDQEQQPITDRRLLLAMAAVSVVSFWIGRRFFGKQAPIAPSVPT